MPLDDFEIETRREAKMDRRDIHRYAEKSVRFVYDDDGALVRAADVVPNHPIEEIATEITRVGLPVTIRRSS